MSKWIQTVIGPELILVTSIGLLHLINKPATPRFIEAAFSFGVPVLSSLTWMIAPKAYWRLARIIASNTVLLTVATFKALPNWSWSGYGSLYSDLLVTGPLISCFMTLLVLGIEAVFLLFRKNITVVTVVDGILRSVGLGVAYSFLLGFALAFYNVTRPV